MVSLNESVRLLLGAGKISREAAEQNVHDQTMIQR
jgi:hypothetical protein